MLVGLVSAAEANKTGTIKDNKIIKDDNNLQLTIKVKENVKTLNKDNKEVSKKNKITKTGNLTIKDDSRDKSYNDYDRNSKLKLSYQKVKDKTYLFSVTAKNSYGNPIDDEVVVFNIDDNFEYEKRLSDGHATIKKKLTKGDHICYVSSPYEKYDEIGKIIFSNDIQINSKPVSMTVDAPKKVDVAKKIKVNVKIKDDDKSVGSNGTLKLYINDKHVSTRTPNNGKVTFSLGNKKVGTNVLEFKYITSYKQLITKNVKMEVTRKEEQMSLKVPSKATTNQKISIKSKITNDTTKLNRGQVKYYLNDRLIATKNVKNGAASLSYRLPVISGSYFVEADYVNKKRILTTELALIKVTNGETLSFSTPYMDFLPNLKYTFKAKVKSPNAKVNYGSVMFVFNGKSIGTRKVKNGIASLTYKLPSKENSYSVKVVYLKNNKKILTSSDYLFVSYTHQVRPDTPLDFARGSNVVINATVLTNDLSKAQSGKVAFYRNNKYIGSARVYNGIAKLNYKANDNPGVYRVTAVYYNNKNQQASKVSKGSRMWVIGYPYKGPGVSVYKYSSPPDNTGNWVINSAKWVRAVVYRNGNFIDYHGLNVNHKYSYSDIDW